MSVERAQRELDSVAFSEAMVFDEAEPPPIVRVEYMLGMLCSMFANAYGRSGSKTYKVDDFLLDDPWQEPSRKPAQDPDAMERQFAMFAAIHNERIKQ